MYELRFFMTRLMPRASAFGVADGVASASSGLRTAVATAKPASSNKPRRMRLAAPFLAGESLRESCSMNLLQWKLRQTKFVLRSTIYQSLENAEQLTLPFKTPAGNFRQRDVAVLHGNIVGESTERLKNSWV